MLNENLSKVDAQWLVNEYAPKASGIVSATTIGMFVKAINLIRGRDMKIPSCSCEWLQMAKLAKSYYQQYQSEIEVIANRRNKRKNNAV